MATSQGVKLISGEAGSAVTVYRLVSLATDGQFDHTAAGARPDGVCAESQSTVGGAFPIAIPNGSVVKVCASAAITVGDLLECSGSGKVATGSNPGAGDYWVGVAMTAAGADGDIIEMLFNVDRDQVA